MCNFLSFVLCRVVKARHICVVQIIFDDMSFMPRISLLHRESLMSCISLCHAAHLNASCLDTPQTDAARNGTGRAHCCPLPSPSRSSTHTLTHTLTHTHSHALRETAGEKKVGAVAPVKEMSHAMLKEMSHVKDMSHAKLQSDHLRVKPGRGRGAGGAVARCPHPSPPSAHWIH